MKPKMIFSYIAAVITLVASLISIINYLKGTEDVHNHGDIKITQNSSGSNSPNSAVVSQTKK